MSTPGANQEADGPGQNQAGDPTQEGQQSGGVGGTGQGSQGTTPTQGSQPVSSPRAGLGTQGSTQGSFEDVPLLPHYRGTQGGIQGGAGDIIFSNPHQHGSGAWPWGYGLGQSMPPRGKGPSVQPFLPILGRWGRAWDQHQGQVLKVNFSQTAAAEGESGAKEVLKLLGQYLVNEMGKNGPGKGGAGAVAGKGGGARREMF